MKKITLFFMSLFVAVGSMAQVTVNTSAYTIKSVNRGFLYYDAKNAGSVTSSSHTNITNATPTGDVIEQFAFLRTDNTASGHYYLYSIGASQFVTYTGSNGVKLELTDEPVSTWTLVEKTEYSWLGSITYYGIKVPNTEKTYINITNWEAVNGCKVFATGLDDGNKMTLNEVKTELDLDQAIEKIENFENISIVKAELKAALDKIKTYIDNNVIGTAPGQYSSGNINTVALAEFCYDSELAYWNTITNKTQLTEIQEHIDFVKSFKLNMPVDGKAYVIKAKYNNGTYRYIYDNGTKIQMTSTKPTDLSSTFVFRKIDDEGNYALVNNDGQYMVFYADGKKGAGGTSNGLASTFELGENDAIIKFVDATKCSITSGSANPAVDFLGCFALQAIMHGDGMHYIMAGDPDFHNGQQNAFYYSGGNRSSVFVLEEVEYANKPYLTNVGESELLTSDLRNKAMATFSAPFSTVIPDGVKAYYATSGNGYVSLNEIEEEAIPANTGVILVADNYGQIIMLPATTETIANIEEGANTLGHSAGAAKEIAANAGYILANGENGIGFYASSGGMLAMNKSYLNIPATASLSIEIRLPGTTGVEKVEIRNGKEDIYDLTGRRVNEITKAGVYIVNGKKTLVK